MWKEGTLGVKGNIFHYWVKQYEEPSQFGIEGGRVSKLMLKRKGQIVCNYDRDWDIRPVDENTEIALRILPKDYN